MRCANCGFENPEGMKFCGECATPLQNRCPSCGFVNPPRFKFCGECAMPLSEQSSVKHRESRLSPSQPPARYTPTHLAERILAEREAMAARGASDGERKLITALFADLKGSTALIEDLDPEEARALIDPALQLMMDAVHRYEGYVAQALGDGIFALFGAPIAHEDHAQRALYAALRMQEEMRRYSDRMRVEKGVPLQIRVGLNTGEVVVRSIRTDDLHVDYVPVGHSTNIAVRMEQLATPGSIVVSEHTHKLTAGYFGFKALGAVQVKGVGAPLSIYEVLGVGPLKTRLQVTAQRGLTRFVGRQSELEHLERALAQARAGHGQIVGVMGEPGVGKSRLFHEFKARFQRDCFVLETFSVSHGKAYAYLPLMELLKNYCHLTVQDDERTRREKITGRVLTLDRNLEETLPYLFFLLGLAEPSSPLQQMDPQVRRRRTLDAIKRLLIRESLHHPLLLIFEDLHWLDGETQAFLHVLSESLATTPILLLVNYRPEYQHEWGSKTYYTQVRLDPLGQAEADELLTALLAEKGGGMPEASLQPLKQLILAKTEGNPFFMEEIVQELIEQGVLARDAVGARRGAPLPQALHIPTTVQGILAARIDRLAADEKTLLQMLAVLGKQFAWGLLQRVTEQPEEELHRLLSTLQAKEFIYEQPAFPESDYVFKHALTQEVAYNAVLTERRKVLHERTAQAMEAVYHTRLDDHYSELAHHYSRSGNTEKAITYLGLAGQQAVQRSANAEAISHLTLALELLNTLPDTPERAQQELTLQLALGPPLMYTKSPTASEVGAVYTRARQLCQQAEDTSRLFPVLFGLWRFHFMRMELQTARELGGQLMHLAQSVQDSALLLEAHRVLGVTWFFLGEFAPAREQLERGIALYNPQQHRSQASLYGQDPGVACRMYAAYTLWHLGYPNQAGQRSREALSLAQELSHSFTLAWTLFFAARFCHFCREARATQEQAEAVMTLATAQGFPQALSVGTVLQGWALVEQGQEEGFAQMRQGLAIHGTMGVELERPYLLALLAEAYGKVGQAKAGLAVLAEALALVRKTEGLFWEAELYRLKGQLVLQSSVRGPASENPKPQHPTPDTLEEAEACFWNAIAIARQQQAKSLELRATMSLARLWQQQEKKEEAKQMLAEIYSWFTEGFETKDLQEAHALLEELGR